VTPWSSGCAWPGRDRVALGVTLLLLALTVVPALPGRAERVAWQHTSARTPATAADAALWLAVSDHYAGDPLLRIYVAPLGPGPPVPPRGYRVG